MPFTRTSTRAPLRSPDRYRGPRAWMWRNSRSRRATLTRAAPRKAARSANQARAARARYRPRSGQSHGRTPSRPAPWQITPSTALASSQACGSNSRLPLAPRAPARGRSVPASALWSLSQRMGDMGYRRRDHGGGKDSQACRNGAMRFRRLRPGRALGAGPRAGSASPGGRAPGWTPHAASRHHAGPRPCRG
jgi:hypothetical protein